MESKTKIKVAIVIALIIIAVIFILMVVFVKGNPPTNKNNIPTKTFSKDGNNTGAPNNNVEDNQDEGEDITLEGITSLAIYENKLVKVKEDKSFEEVKDFGLDENKEIIDYTYDENKVYFVYNDKSTLRTTIYSIDLLKSNYPESLVYESDSEDYLNDLIVKENKIYYVTKDKKIIEYSINEDVRTSLISDSSSVVAGSLEISKNENKLYYIGTENGASAVFSIDLGTGQTQELLNGFSNGTDLLLYKDKYLVCGIESLNYLYNIETRNVIELSNNISENTNEENFNVNDYVAFYKEDFIICNDSEKISLKDFEGNILNEELFKIDEDEYKAILKISMLSESKLQIILSGSQSTEEKFSVKIIDFDANTIADGQNVYFQLINID